MKPSSMSRVITATASPRRPHSIDSTRSMRGHVAMTMVTAHNAAGRNGWRTQKLVRLSPATNETASVTRTGSRDASVSITVLPASAQRLVDPHHGQHLVTSRAHEPELRVEQLALAVEHLEIARDSATVAGVGEARRFARGHDERFLLEPELLALAVLHEPVRHLAKRLEDRLAVPGERLLDARPGGVHACPDAPGGEDRQGDRGADREQALRPDLRSVARAAPTAPPAAPAARRTARRRGVRGAWPLDSGRGAR